MDNFSNDLVAGGNEGDNFSFAMPAVIVPKPFTISRHSLANRKKIVDEIMEKADDFWASMSNFYPQWSEIADSYRMLSSNKSRKNQGLYDSKVGETHRAINTLATLWFRMFTSADPYFEVYATSRRNDGMDYTEEELYGTRELMLEQHRELKFKPNLLKSLISLAGFGTVFVEKPWVQTNNGMFEGTKFKPRSLITCGFEANVADIDESDFVFFVDYMSKWKLRTASSTEGSIWDKSLIQKYLNAETETMSEGKMSQVESELNTRKQRAGYNVLDKNLLEMLTYHGKLDTNNPVFEDFWEREGRTDDINNTDWTVGIMNGEEMVRFHTTPMGTWKHVVEVAHYNQFEEEAIGYGAGRLVRRTQAELDMIVSRINDAMMMAIYSMFKSGQMSGLNLNQLNIKPFHIVQMFDIDQFKRLDPIDINAMVHGMQMANIRIEDLRATSGATSNLQAQITAATATEASLTQSESMRANGVAAEVIGEPLLRGYFRTQHVNNCYLLDKSIAVNIGGTAAGRILEYVKDNLPFNLGFKIKITTDKDFRPERLKRILELINLASSVRQIFPETINAIRPLFDESFRLMGMDPALLSQPKTPQELWSERMQRMGKSNMGAAVQNELSGEIAGVMSGSPSIANLPTPVGSVPVSAPGGTY